jgi:hypothetical protein
VFAAGVRAPQPVDAMAIVYMALTLVWLLIARRFVNPTQLVSRAKDQTTAGAHYCALWQVRDLWGYPREVSFSGIRLHDTR